MGTGEASAVAAVAAADQQGQLAFANYSVAGRRVGAGTMVSNASASLAYLQATQQDITSLQAFQATYSVTGGCRGGLAEAIVEQCGQILALSAQPNSILSSDVCTVRAAGTASAITVLKAGLYLLSAFINCDGLTLGLCSGWVGTSASDRKLMWTMRICCRCQGSPS